MAIDIDKYRNQQKQTAVNAVNNLKEAYAFISILTNMPYACLLYTSKTLKEILYFDIVLYGHFGGLGIE